MRPVKIETGVNLYAEGSCIIEYGSTRVLCTASLEEQPPRWLQGSGKGWVTAEYGMLPRSTHDRLRREKSLTSGRTQEISRLIGRSLRAVTDLSLLGERSVVVDCDVLQADGGTRTAAITGGFIALVIAINKVVQEENLQTTPLLGYVSAISAGWFEGQMILDLNYYEDSQADADVNLVMTHRKEIVEVQGTSERKCINRTQLNEIADLCEKGCMELQQLQLKALTHAKIDVQKLLPSLS